LSQTNYTYHYDDNGNLIDKTTDNKQTRYVYDALDRLIEVHNGSDVTVYTYDSFHRRLSKKQNGVAILYLYQNQNEIGALNQGEITQLRILGVTYGAEIGGAIALELNGKVYAPIHDPHGNIVALLDTNGNHVEGYRYTAFGEIQVFPENTVDNPWRFSSKRYDTETGFVYFGRRYYDPVIGRWTTPDPAGYADGPNLYAYVHNRTF
jgi:RHS repeat-associated protein